MIWASQIINIVNPRYYMRYLELWFSQICLNRLSSSANTTDSVASQWTCAVILSVLGSLTFRLCYCYTHWSSYCRLSGSRVLWFRQFRVHSLVFRLFALLLHSLGHVLRRDLFMILTMPFLLSKQRFLNFFPVADHLAKAFVICNILQFHDGYNVGLWNFTYVTNDHRPSDKYDCVDDFCDWVNDEWVNPKLSESQQAWATEAAFTRQRYQVKTKTLVSVLVVRLHQNDENA